MQYLIFIEPQVNNNHNSGTHLTVKPIMTISNALISWYRKNGRFDLPWQNPRTPYRVWVSEIMLQQTQVKTVIPYFERFLLRFPTIEVLSQASEDEVLSHWSGLGYYSRARNLHKTAKIIAKDYQGQFPCDLEKLQHLPGVGPSTAAAIRSLAFNLPAAILDGNVRRILSRFFLVSGQPNQVSTQKQLWEIANHCSPQTSCTEYTQAIMDLGATCCTISKPKCPSCPLNTECKALKCNQVHLFPEKKLKKAKPLKEKQFLLLHHANLIYLEKLPPVGIWGGLWSLPNIEKEKDVVEFIENAYGLEIKNKQEILSFKHSFTHFTLKIHASAYAIETIQKNSVHEAQGRWYGLDEIKNLGVPKPVTTIIQTFLSST